jgi:serine protease AprX
VTRRTSARRACACALSTTIILAIGALFAALAEPARASSGAPTHIVQLRPGVSFAEGRALVRAAHGRVTGTLPIIRGLAVRLAPGGRARLAHDAGVAAVSVNAPIRSQDAVSGTMAVAGQVAGIDTSNLVPAYPLAVRAQRVWHMATGFGIGVAVIDTGIDGGLPDFADANGNSRVVASVVTDPNATTAADTYGHGTHVAGIIAGDGTRRPAGDPDAGRYIGIAPEANLIAIKAADDAGRGTILDAIYGLQFAVDHQSDYNIRVVNLSLSSTVAESYHTDPLDAAVESAYFHGILVVAAAGNRGSDQDAVDYAPGNDPFAISVGAVDDGGTATRWDDQLTDWSSRGTTQDGVDKPEVVAPGAHIVSTLAPGSAFAALCPACVVDGGYIRLGGTSMAAPVVSGLAALVFEAHPDWTPDEAKSTIIDTARALPGGVSEVNAAAAVWTSTPSSSTGDNVVPNDLVDPAGGAIDYARSSWGRSSWGAAPEGLVAGWARSSWGCVCSTTASGDADTTRSSWGSAEWLVRWG